MTARGTTDRQVALGLSFAKNSMRLLDRPKRLAGLVTCARLAARRVHRGVRLHLDLFQCPVEKSDDFKVKSLVHGVAIETIGISSGFACGVFQCVRKAGYEGKMSGTLD